MPVGVESGVPAEGVPDGVGVGVGSALARLETPTAAPRAVTATAADTTKAFFGFATYSFLLLERRCADAWKIEDSLPPGRVLAAGWQVGMNGRALAESAWQCGAQPRSLTAAATSSTQ